jgi:hypothetical protein
VRDLGDQGDPGMLWIQAPGFTGDILERYRRTTEIYIYLEPKRPAEIGQTRVLKKVQVSLKSTALCKILDFGHFQESSRNI